MRRLFRSRFFGWLFLHSEALDSFFHERQIKPNPLCRIVGAMERHYYDARIAEILGARRDDGG